MQDRYLFRGKRIDNGEWAIGCYAEFINYLDGDGKPGIQIIKQVPSGFDRMIPAFETELIEVDPATVGQCTGLKDKNGRLVFEGDIVKGRNEHEISDVIYKDGVWALEMFLGHLPALWEIGPMEVIDNIHDKSEVE